MRAPSAWNFVGSFRKSLISCSSSIASSEPATSSKVTVGVSLVTSFARDLPNCMILLPPPCDIDSSSQNTRPRRMTGTARESRLSTQVVRGTTSL
jgi:hypothetical protein